MSIRGFAVVMMSALQFFTCVQASRADYIFDFIQKGTQDNLGTLDLFESLPTTAVSSTDTFQFTAAGASFFGDNDTTVYHLSPESSLTPLLLDNGLLDPAAHPKADVLPVPDPNFSSLSIVISGTAAEINAVPITAADPFSIGTFDLVGGSSVVPEPSSFALLALGGIGLAIGVHRRRRPSVA